MIPSVKREKEKSKDFWIWTSDSVVVIFVESRKENSILKDVELRASFGC